MTTFVVLAAGRGSRLGRLGDELPKCLLPLDGRAVISHQFALAPRDAQLVVVTGYRADQVEEYVRLAHPNLNVAFVREEAWGRGPGASLLEARDVVGDDDLVFVACDTLWERDDSLWTDDSESWVAVAPLPSGTPAARWCRVVPGRARERGRRDTLRLDDKTPSVAPGSLCWTALARVAAEDLEFFWRALVDADLVAGEVQLSTGLQAIVDRGEPLWSHPVRWLDVGDDAAYRVAVASQTGYDPLKPDQLTYVLPHQRRVVKWHVDPGKLRRRVERARLLGDAVAAPIEPVGRTLAAFEYVQGSTLYQQIDAHQGALTDALKWWNERFWSTRLLHSERPSDWRDRTTRFYRDKTFSRVMSLDRELSVVALDAVTRVDWDQLAEGCVPGAFHGDLTPANVICWDDDWNLRFAGIDWREDFDGTTAWGDLRYDLGKLLGGTYVHWERAQRGDFGRWELGALCRATIEHVVTDLFDVDLDDVRRVAALTLLGSAPLHAAPLDEILVARGCQLLDEVT